MDLHTPSSPEGLPTLSLTTNSSWLPWGRVVMPLISPLMPILHVFCLILRWFWVFFMSLGPLWLCCITWCRSVCSVTELTKPWIFQVTGHIAIPRGNWKGCNRKGIRYKTGGGGSGVLCWWLFSWFVWHLTDVIVNTMPTPSPAPTKSRNVASHSKVVGPAQCMLPQLEQVRSTVVESHCRLWIQEQMCRL